MYITIHIEAGDTCFRDMSSQDDLPSRLDNQAARFHHRLREADGSTFVGVDVTMDPWAWIYILFDKTKTMIIRTSLRFS